MNNVQNLTPLRDHLISSTRQGKDRSTLASVSLIVLYALTLFIPLFGTTGIPQDEGILLVYPERILHGEIPYRDFEYLYGPGALAPLVGVFAITGPNIIAERAVGLMYRLAIILAIYFLARRWGQRSAVAAGLLASFFLLLTGLSAFAWLGGMAFVLWSMVAFERRHIGKAGLLAGLALTFRPDLIVAVTLATPVLLVGRSRRDWRTFIQGAVIGLSPYLALLVLIGPTLIYDTLVRMPLRIGPARHLPIGDSADLLLLLGLSLAALIMLSVQRRDKHLFALSALSVGLLPQAFQRADAVHWAYVACVVIALVPGAFTYLPQRIGRLVTTVGGVLVMMLVMLGLAVSWYGSPAPVVSAGNRWFPLDDRRVPMLQNILDAVNRKAMPGDRLFVGTSDLSRPFMADTFLYHLLPNLQPASYYLELNPGSANRTGSRLADDVASADYLILTRWYERPEGTAEKDRMWLMQEPEQAWQQGDRQAQQIVDEQFCTVARYGMYQLLERCD